MRRERRRADLQPMAAPMRRAVSEHAMMLMLAVCRKLIGSTRAWFPALARATTSTRNKLYELEDKTLGIVGLGNIGKKVARRAKAFECTSNIMTSTG